MRITARIILIVSLAILAFTSQGQNFIGLHKDIIREKVKKELPGFAFTKEVLNNNRSFIKFENGFEEQTLIFMLNSEGVCTSVSRMYNTWLYNRLKDDLLKKHGEGSNSIWYEEINGKTFEIELVKGQWFITIITRSKD
jgi:hypothetical protein